MPQERGLYGEETAQKIDAEIKRILERGARHGARASSPSTATSWSRSRTGCSKSRSWKATSCAWLLGVTG